MQEPARYNQYGDMLVSFKGQPVAPFYIKTIITETIAQNQPDLFTKLNDFWKTKSEEFQQQVSNIYSLLFEALTKETNEATKTELIREYVNDLIELHPVEELKAWLTIPGNQMWPTVDLPLYYDHSNSSRYPREKTYLQDDYKSLMAFVLQTRLLVPVWGEFLKDTDISGRYKLGFALNLTIDSNYAEGEGYRKLRAYVDATLKTSADALETGVLEMVSKEDYPEWIFSELILRKLTYLPFNAPKAGDMSAYAVKHLGSHIMEKVRKSESYFKSGKDKTMPDVTGSEENQRSSYETCAIKASMPAGDIYYMQYYLSEWEKRAMDLAPDMPPELARRFMSSIDVSSFIPSDEQMYLLRWTFSPIVSPRIFNDITKVVCNQCLAVAGAVLWHWGHKELAVFTTARYEIGRQDDTVTAQDTTRLNKATQDMLEQLYPYNRLRRPSNSKPYQVVTNTVKEFSDRLRDKNWFPTLDNELLKDVETLVQGTTLARRFIIPQNVRTLLYEVFNTIVSHQQVLDPMAVADEKAIGLGMQVPARA